MDENYRLFFNIKLPELIVEEEQDVEKRKRRGDEEGKEYEEGEFEEEFEGEELPAEQTEADKLTAEKESKVKLLKTVMSSKIFAGALGLQPVSPEITGGEVVLHRETLIEEHTEEAEQEQKLKDIVTFLESLRAAGTGEGVGEEEGDGEKGLLLYPKDEVGRCNFLILHNAVNKVAKSCHLALE